MSYKIGIDVGGTNTDAVVVDEAGKIIASTKSATTRDPFDGIRESLSKVIANIDKRKITQAMLGTTHPANAIIQRNGLERVGVLRLAAPASMGIRPGAGWPTDLVNLIMGPSEIIRGGNEFDGSEISPLDEDAVRKFASRCAGTVSAISVAGIFSPANYAHEQRAAEILAQELGADFPVSMSHQVGALGMLERENANILNSSLLSVARHVVTGFHSALRDNELNVDSYLTQNDGTLMTADEAVRFPVLTLGSGPTNSMRGACSLAELSNALVVDVGGTSADVGILVDGFPRESTASIEVGGVRTNFRMPDLISIGLGGGSVVRTGKNGVAVGPDSVGYRVVEDALVCGGSTLTLSDVSVRGGRLKGFGDPALADNVDPAIVAAALAWVDEQVHMMADRMKASRHTLPLIAVGGGAHLIPDSIQGITEVVRPAHYEVANAFGAAIAEASGTIDRVFRYEEQGRESCLDEARNLAVEAAARSGADPNKIRITSISEVPLSYVPGQACRVQVKAAGQLVRG